MYSCTLCPRECGSDRDRSGSSFCGESRSVTVSRAMLHMWEEPSISGERGSGAIFFCGCSLRCVFCQNKTISRGGGARRELSKEKLESLMLRLRDAGAHNINLVTPTHFADTLARVLEKIKPTLDIPIIYNTSGYEKVETLRMLEGLVDVYLPDFKYASSELAKRYSNAFDYPLVAQKALGEMYRQTGEAVFDENGMIKRGVIIRHLLLPSHRKDSMEVLDRIAEAVPVEKVRLSLMSQYTPEFALDCEYKNLHRRVTSFEYSSVLDYAVSLGFEGYFQERSSASDSFTPNFNDGDMLKNI